MTRKIYYLGKLNLPCYKNDDGSVTIAKGTPEFTQWEASMARLRKLAVALGEKNKS